ncbi:MAG: hypothetical protein WCO33_01670 [bacterium]
MGKDLKQLTKMVNEFSESRGWVNQSPNLLISSMVSELGELAEHFHYNEGFERSAKERKEIGYEFVDLFFYLLRFASECNVDLEKDFLDKFEKLKIKFPAKSDMKKQKKAHEEYKRTGKNKTY